MPLYVCELSPLRAERRCIAASVARDLSLQLILHIPFTGTVRIKAIVVHGGHPDQAPRTVKLYVNRDIDFESSESAAATHTINMPTTMSDEAEFPLSLAKFNNVSSLSLFVSDNYGGDVCSLQYVGLKGTFLAPKVDRRRRLTPRTPTPTPPLLSPLPHRLQVRVGAIKNAVYESKPQMQGAGLRGARCCKS